MSTRDGFTWLCVRGCLVKQIGPQAFEVHWADRPGAWELAQLVTFTSRATLLRLPRSWLLLTHVAPPVSYLREADARAAFGAADGA